MTQNILLLLAFIAANLPFFSERLFHLVPLKTSVKSLPWCLLEWLVLYFVMGIIAMFVEKSVMGQIAPQAWEFYATTFCLFLVFAFPGFIYRYFWK
jgi:Na+(H+)/acetate symporter ActP